MQTMERARLMESGELKLIKSSMTKDITTVCSEVLRTEFFHIKLRGHEKLFMEQFQFSKASTFFSERPLLTAEPTLIELVPSFDSSVLEAILKYTLSGTREFLLNYTSDSGAENPDAVFLKKIFPCFLTEPNITMRQIYFNGVSDKPLGQGSIDVMAGTMSNGSKPIVKVKGSDQQMNETYLWVTAEAKEFATPLYGTRMPVQEDLKALYQTITQLCSTSELCDMPNPNVPLIEIYRSRYSYRPFLYFQEHDVMLTTRKPFTYFDDQKRIDLHGIAFLRVLSMLHQYPFQDDFLTCSDRTLGWKDAKHTRSSSVFTGVYLDIEHDGVETTHKKLELIEFVTPCAC